VLEPRPPEYMDRDARVEEQGLDGVWLFPTAGVLYEEAMCHDIEALCVLTEGFDRWLEFLCGSGGPIRPIAYGGASARRQDAILLVRARQTQGNCWE
jgi:hypothetical protein